MCEETEITRFERGIGIAECELVQVGDAMLEMLHEF